MCDWCSKRSAVSMKGRRQSRYRLAQAADLILRAVLSMVHREVATLVHRGALNGNLGGVHGPDGPWEICRHRNRNIRKDVPEGGGPRNRRTSVEVVGEVRGRTSNGTPYGLFTLRQMASQSSEGCICLEPLQGRDQEVVVRQGQHRGATPSGQGEHSVE